MLVHYAGVACEMDAIVEIARGTICWSSRTPRRPRRARTRDAPSAAIGDLGGLQLPRDEERHLRRRRRPRCSTTRGWSSAPRSSARRAPTARSSSAGQVDKYTWVDVGSSYLPSEIVAAYLCAQLEASEAILERRLAICARYREALSGLEAAGALRLPSVPSHCQANGHMFYVLLPDETQRDGLIAELDRRGINTVFHYVPLHESPMGASLGYRRGDLPITEATSRRLVRLPCFYDLDSGQQAMVIDEVHRHLASTAERSAP